MPDLSAAGFRSLAKTRAPDLWTDILEREPQHVRQPSALRRVAIVLTALAMGAAGLVAVLRAFGTVEPSRPADQAVRPATADTVRVGPLVNAVAAGEGSVWATVERDACRSEIVRVDPDAGEVIARVPIDGLLSDLGIGEGAVWVEGYLCEEDDSPVHSVIIRIDPDAAEVTDVLPLGAEPADIAVGAGGVWVTASEPRDEWSGEVLAIDPSTKGVVQRITVVGDPRDIVANDSGIWILNITKPGASDSLSGLEVLHLDPGSGEIAATFRHALGLGVGAEEVWIPLWLSKDEAGLARIDPRTDQMIGEPIVGEFLGFAGDHGTLGTLPAGGGGVWFRRSTADDAVRLIERLNRGSLEIESVEIPDEPAAIDASVDPSSGVLWIATYRDSLIRVAPD